MQWGGCGVHRCSSRGAIRSRGLCSIRTTTARPSTASAKQGSAGGPMPRGRVRWWPGTRVGVGDGSGGGHAWHRLWRLQGWCAPGVAGVHAEGLATALVGDDRHPGPPHSHVLRALPINVRDRPHQDVVNGAVCLRSCVVPPKHSGGGFKCASEGGGHNELCLQRCEMRRGEVTQSQFQFQSVQ